MFKFVSYYSTNIYFKPFAKKIILTGNFIRYKCFNRRIYFLKFYREIKVEIN